MEFIHWLKDNFDKLLLSAVLWGLLGYNLHLVHYKADDAQVQFINGLTSTTLGALLSVITGALLKGKASITSTLKEDPEHGVATSMTLKEEKE